MNSQGIPAIKQGWLRAVLFLFTFILLSIFLLLVSHAFIKNIQNELVKDLANEIVLCIALFANLIFAMRYIDKAPVGDLGFMWNGKDAALGLFLGALLNLSGFTILYALGNLSIVSIQVKPDFILNIFLFALVAVVEEVLVRGYILHNLMQSANKYSALLISSLIFSLMHFFNPNYNSIAFLNIALAGVLLGITYIHVRNLWFPIALHFSWNLVQGPILGFEVSGTDTISIIQTKINGHELLTGGEFGFEGSLIATALIIIFTLFLEKMYQPKTVA